MKEKRINAQSVDGYDKEEFTHMGVASAVASGVADTGMAILTAAIALDLDFVPVTNERYDLVIKNEDFETPMIQALLHIIESDNEFRNSVHSLGGYDVKDMGKIVYEQTGSEGSRGQGSE
jgi:putative molybdopterin biosynthesis protein